MHAADRCRGISAGGKGYRADYRIGGCSALESAVLPTEMEYLRVWCFRNCVSLKTVKMPEKLRAIAKEAFIGCTALESVWIAKCDLTASAFEGCINLKEVELPSSCSSIAAFAFLNCSSLEKVTFKGDCCEFQNADYTTICNGKRGGRNYYGGVICGDEGSSAYYFAKELGMRFEIAPPLPVRYFKGDVDNEDGTTLVDAQAVLREYTEVMSGKEPSLDIQSVLAGDINEDDALTVEDAQLILRYYTECVVAGKEVRWQDLLAD